jgi:hypothetical protein
MKPDGDRPQLSNLAIATPQDRLAGRGRTSIVLWCLLAIVLAGCGGRHVRNKQQTGASVAVARPTTAGDRMLALLPDGAQIIVEVDLARLRTNPVVGALVIKILDGGIPQLAGFSDADGVVFAAYGLGTAQAATITLFTAKQPLEGATKIHDNIYGVGASDWLAQVQTRAALDDKSALVPSKELIELRDRAMPEAAPGASIRIAARLSFDARIALARITGIESAPAQLSVWADVADDLAIIVDADATDPGDKKAKNATKRMSGIVQGALAGLARSPTIIALGLPSSLSGAKLATRGTWVRTIIAVGPRHLQRVVERATTFFAQSPPMPKEGS